VQDDWPFGAISDDISVLLCRRAACKSLKLHYVQFADFGIPSGTGALRAVENFAVGRELQDGYVAEAVGTGTFGDEFGSGVRELGAALLVMASGAFEIAFGGFAAGFIR
jgi:hypothetical protein